MSGQKEGPIRRILDFRRKQLGFRLAAAAVIALCYGDLLGWVELTGWFILYAGLQYAELWFFSARRPLFAELTPAANAVAIATIAANSVVFGSLSVLDVARIGAWGGACAAYLLAGSMLNTVLTTIQSKAVFIASLTPFVLYSFASSLIALSLHAPPPPLIVVALCIGGAMLTSCSIGLWRDGRIARDAEAAAVERDIAERAASEERLFRLAHHDNLTGLSNRLVLQTHLEALAASSSTASLLMIDLDGFKLVNDTQGHSAGDAVLREVARRLVTSSRPGDVCVRLGGDEFALLLTRVPDRTDALQVADRIIRAISEPIALEGRTVSIGASVGIALHPSDGRDAEELFASADLALYQAKGEGRHCARTFSQRLKTEALGKVSRDAELQRALERDELELFYQPQVSLLDGRLVGAEALLRWRHPQSGLLMPGTFLPALETGRLAATVGEWVMRKACDQAAGWRRHHQPDFRVSVNLFGAQFRSGNLARKTLDILRQAHLPPAALELEITENIILRHEDDIIVPLRQLRDHGVGIAFDDYGTGYASLSLLKRYPLSRLKIDQSFTQAACNSASDTAIINAIFSMAGAFNLAVIAEGVETQAQADLLRRLGCEEAQGYRFSRPIPPSEFAAKYFPPRDAGPASPCAQAASARVG